MTEKKPEQLGVLHRHDDGIEHRHYDPPITIGAQVIPAHDGSEPHEHGTLKIEANE